MASVQISIMMHFYRIDAPYIYRLCVDMISGTVGIILSISYSCLLVKLCDSVRCVTTHGPGLTGIEGAAPVTSRRSGRGAELWL